MKVLKLFSLLMLFGSFVLISAAESSGAGFGRQYYGGWSYHTGRGYHYARYNYQPYAGFNGYNYHYCIYYPSQPRYVYYYNPYRSVYWGRYDVEAKGYSQLAPKDQKADLKDIPETAFPKPGPMPRIPDAKDDLQIAPVPSLPKGT